MGNGPEENGSALIGLLTDFGLNDWYVAAIKGEILRRLPGARLLDISHGVPAQQIEAGAFLLGCVLDSMPKGMVFCCVVDPGVGTPRRAICGRIGPWFFAGPDNGLATPLLDRIDGDFALYEIESSGFRAETVSSTFHGRDLFAPAAAALAAGIPPERAGRPVSDPVILPLAMPEELGQGLVARVMLVDHFGNLVTNVTREAYEELLSQRPFLVRAGVLRLDGISQTFGHVRQVEPLAYWGSAGTLEIAVNHGSAAQVTGLKPGDSVYLDWL